MNTKTIQLTLACAEPVPRIAAIAAPRMTVLLFMVYLPLSAFSSPTDSRELGWRWACRWR